MFLFMCFLFLFENQQNKLAKALYFYENIVIAGLLSIVVRDALGTFSSMVAVITLECSLKMATNFTSFLNLT